MSFSLGDIIKNKNPYKGEGEYMVVDFERTRYGRFYGYKCARLKGKHVKEHDFENLQIITEDEACYYENVND